MTMKTMTDEQRKFAEENHELVYAFLSENGLSESLYYDVVIFGFLLAVQEYCENAALGKYKFATIAWKKMMCALKDYYRHLSKDVYFHDDILPISDVVSKYANIQSKNMVEKQDEIMAQLETDLLLHTLASKLSPREVRIIRMKLNGARMHDIAKAERITFHEIKKLLAGSYETVLEILLE